ncbi:MAG: lytic murein transglycosylase [Desulfarculus sp.]|nr:lytic murein transglycosylase [Desulfarculus sp.]
MRRSDRATAFNHHQGRHLILAGLFWLFTGLCLAPAAQAGDAIFAVLRPHLLAQGFPSAQVDALLAQPGLRFEAKLLANLLARHERTLDYGQFLTPGNVSQTRKFKQRHAAKLKAASDRTGVPPEVVVAIISVESGLGSYTGRWPTLNVLASQAVLDQPAALARLAPVWPANQRDYLGGAECQARFVKRAAWAREELVGLMRLAARDRRPAASYRGSPAGALGMAQFVPTSVLRWGADGDRDGRVDLNRVEDAILSVAVYLQAHGWRPGLDRAGQYAVVHEYNHSQTYVNTVLELARRVR